MKRRTVLKLLAAPALMSVARPGFAQAKEKVTYAYLLDPAYDAVTWAMTNGKVDLRPDHGGSARACDSATDPGDVGQTVRRDHDGGDRHAAGGGARARAAHHVGCPAAGGGRRGRRHLGEERFCRCSRPQELKGKSLGSYGLRSTGYTQVRIALIHKYGLNAALEGGDLKQVEIQAPNLPAALATGQIDAATLIHSQAFRAMKSGEFRPIAETGRDNIELYGMRFISALNVAYPERIAQRPDAYREFNRMFRESVKYALAHKDEVFGAVGEKNNLPPEFFNWWFEKSSTSRARSRRATRRRS